MQARRTLEVDCCSDNGDARVQAHWTLEVLMGTTPSFARALARLHYPQRFSQTASKNA